MRKDNILKRNVLVLGSGGREYAICIALEKSNSVGNIIIAPGNSSMALRWSCKNITLTDQDAIISLALNNNIDLVIVGPEICLVNGITDLMNKYNIPIFGPTAFGANLEGSKVFMKRFAQEFNIPTAPFEIFTTSKEAKDYIQKLKAPPVIKADGLCSGKGVIVSEDITSALDAVDDILDKHIFGSAGNTIIIEERIAGQEISIHALCDGENYILLPIAQDHKRINDNDTGLNTGGMGTYAPVPISSLLKENIRTLIIEPTLKGMRDKGHPFKGVLFAGIMITPQNEPILLEFNVRFGDPEAQVILPLLDGDFVEACYACATGSLQQNQLKVNSMNAICVVLAAKGYPQKIEVGDLITGLDKIKECDNLIVYHTGTQIVDDQYVTASGRVLNIVAIENSLMQAKENAYTACEKINFNGMHYRTDIAAKALLYLRNNK